MTAERDGQRGPVVGSWPGPSFGTNDFVRLYAEALEAAGCTVVDIASPLRVREPIDVLHIHWPEQLMWQGGTLPVQALRIARALLAISRLRHRGTRIVWMVHNLRPHELTGRRRQLWAIIERTLPKRVDGVMTLSPATLPMVVETFPALRGKPAAAVSHPRYPAEHAPSKTDARARLNLPIRGRVLAMLGFLRAYKGAESLLTTFRELSGDDRRLVIAGRCHPDYAAELREVAGDDPRIILDFRALPDEDLVMYSAAADWIVLPFADYLHSGSMVHAVSFSRPVLTPRAPFAQDLAAKVGNEMVRTYDGSITHQMLANLPVENSAPDLSALSPEVIGGEARRFYEQMEAVR